eukprot:2369331-Rhodomonas_salina.1
MQACPGATGSLVPGYNALNVVRKLWYPCARGAAKMLSRNALISHLSVERVSQNGVYPPLACGALPERPACNFPGSHSTFLDRM